MRGHLRSLTVALGALPVAAIAGPVLGAGLLARARRAEERRDRTVALLEDFLGEPMASTRRAAWALLTSEDVRHFSHYYLTDPTYGEVTTQDGIVAVLKVLLFQRTVQDLRAAGELDERLYQALLEPHRQAWVRYTERMAECSATHPDAVARGDAGLFTWRVAP